MKIKERALAEKWEGGIADTYQAILYKDDHQETFILRERYSDNCQLLIDPIYPVKQVVTTLSEEEALIWVIQSDLMKWTNERLMKEFSPTLVDKFLGSMFRMELNNNIQRKNEKQLKQDQQRRSLFTSIKDIAAKLGIQLGSTFSESSSDPSRNQQKLKM